MAHDARATLVIRAVNTAHMGFYSDALINLRHSNSTRTLPPLAFPARLYRARVVENTQIGTELGITITVAEARLYGDQLTYRVEPQNIIEIDKNGRLTTVEGVDLESLQTTPAGIYRLDVIASNGTHEATTKLEVKIDDVNEFSPEFESAEYEVMINEVVTKLIKFQIN